MKLVSYNIQYCKGADDRFDPERIARELEGADIIALQEVERFWQRSGMVDQPAVLGDLLPDYYWVFGPNYDMDSSYRDDAGRLVNRRRQFGNMIMARWPIVSSRNYALPKQGTLPGRQHVMQRGILEGVIATDEGPHRVYSTHLCHLSSHTRLPQVAYVRQVVHQAPYIGGAWTGGHPEATGGWTEGGVPPMPHPAILMGDMNFKPADPEYPQLVGGTSPQHGRISPLDGFVDAWVEAGHGEDEGTTHPKGGRIDHCFLTPAYAGRVKSAHVDTAATGSDHWPLWVELD